MGRRPPCVQCWSLLIKINILGSAAGCDAGWCWDWARPPQLWPGRLQHEATVARPSQQWWHYRQCAEDRAGGHTSPPHLTSPVSCSDPSEAAASEVCCAVTVSQQWFRTNISSSWPQSNFPKIFQGLQNLSTFWSGHSSFCKNGANLTNSLHWKYLHRIRVQLWAGSQSWSEPCHAPVQTCKRGLMIYTILGKGSEGFAYQLA